MYRVVTVKTPRLVWGLAGDESNSSRKAWESGLTLITVPSEVSPSEGRSMGWFDQGWDRKWCLEEDRESSEDGGEVEMGGAKAGRLDLPTATAADLFVLNSPTWRHMTLMSGNG